MTLQLVALGICVVLFAVGAVRGVNLGILALASACGVGVWLAGMSMENVLAGFPIDLLFLLVGVTLFFGVAQANGTVDRLINAALRKVGDRSKVLPLAFFGMTAAVGSMGSPGAALAMIPIGMSTARKMGVDPMLMCLALGSGFSAGAFAPTSMYGIVTYGIALKANIALSPMTLFAVAVAFNMVLLGVAHLIFGRSSRRSGLVAQVSVEHAGSKQLVTVGGDSGSAGSPGVSDDGPEDVQPGPMSAIQKVTVVCMAALVGILVGGTALGATPDVGAVAFGLVAVLVLLDPSSSRAGIRKIDWSTVLLVCGIVTYVGVLKEIGAIDLLGKFAGSISVPLLAALVLCAVAGLASAFASTIGMLAALVPLAIPLVVAGGIPGWAMICAIAVCASIVDVSPFSTVGATMVATVPDESERPRVTRLLTRWGLSMVVVGPLAMIGGLVLPAMIF